MSSGEIFEAREAVHTVIVVASHLYTSVEDEISITEHFFTLQITGV